MNDLANQKIIKIAIPMMLTSMSVPLLGLVDTFLLGHLPSARFLGAVAIGANFIGLLFWAFGFLRMGTTSLVAQAFGRQQAPTNTGPVELDALVFRAGVMALLGGLAIVALAPLLVPTVVGWMQASNEVAPFAEEYIRIRLFAAPAALATYVIAGWLIGTQQPNKALLLVLISNLVNIVLSVLFILELGMNSAGAAWATLIAEYCACAAGLWMLGRHSQVLDYRRWSAWLDLGAARELLVTNSHLLVRTLLLLFAMNFFTAQGAAIGDSVLAANAILLQLAMLSAYVMDGFSFAAEALCGEATGTRDRSTFTRVTRLCAGWMAATAAVFSLAYLLQGNLIIAQFTDLPEVRQTAQQYLFWLVLMPWAGFMAYLFDGVFIGAGETATMHGVMWIAVAGIFLPAWYLSLGWGNTGLWMAFVLFNLARSLLMLYFYPRVGPQPSQGS